MRRTSLRTDVSRFSRRRVSLAALIAALVCAPRSWTAGQDAEPAGFPIAGCNCWMELVSGDFSGDELPDLVVFRYGGGGEDAEVHLGDGAGVFTPGPVLTTFGVRHRPRAIDLDADGFLDILSTSFDVERGIQCLYGGGNGGLLPALNSSTPGAVVDLKLRDMDGDGIVDAVGSFEDPGTGRISISLLRGTTQRPFGKEVSADVPAPRDTPIVIPGDFNGDGFSDLAFWRWSIPHLAVREGLANGELPLAESEVKGTLERPSHIKLSSAGAADFDGDGRDEMILFVGDQLRSSLFFVVDWTEEGGYVAEQLPQFVRYSGLGLGVFGDPWTRMFVENVDADGRPDVLLLAGFSDRIVVLRNAGGAEELRFERCDIELSAEATSFAYGDFDSDGTLDVASVLPRTGRIEIVFSAAASCSLRRPCLEPESSLVVDAVEAMEVADWTPDPGEEVLTIGGRTARIHSFEAGDLVALSSFDVPPEIQTVGTGDLDQDGVLDLAVGASGLQTVELFFLKDAETGAVERRSLDAGDAVDLLVVDDANGDGVLDVAFTTGLGGTVGVAFGTGSGQFEDPPLIRPVGGSATGLAVGDLVGDSTKDLVVSVAGPDQIRVFEGRSGPNAFQSSIVLVEDVDVSGGLRIAELDGDGENELIAGTEDEAILVVYDVKESPGEWQLQRGGLLPRTDVYVEDLDGDGDAEVLGVTPETRTFTVVRDAGPGLFDWERLLLEEDGPYALAAGDVDGDGFAEVLVSGASGGRLTVLRSSGCRTESTFRRGDVNVDGAVNLSDPVNILGHLFDGTAGLTCLDAADADDDGAVNLSDAVGILQYLFDEGVEPERPGPSDCGSDPTADGLAPCADGCFTR